MNNQLNYYISIEPDFFQEQEEEFGVKIPEKTVRTFPLFPVSSYPLRFLLPFNIIPNPETSTSRSVLFATIFASEGDLCRFLQGFVSDTG